jgi:hypothetical protein
MALIDDLKTRFPDLDAGIIDKYFPIFEKNYKTYYNTEYGLNPDDDEIILNLLAHLIVVSANSSNATNI